ncbi:MAG TPA: pyridoxamine 5'-phosphate oxidase [Ferruginibacter sp.]|nr:pyridoxamine 5'-phosphate oxidase [Ferruginibacter sp.]
MNSIEALRKEYILQTLNEDDVNKDPILQFNVWWDQAINSGIIEANAMTLATADKNGKPSARIVLLKGVEKNGFIFYSNYNSRKGMELEQNPYASLVFFWKELERQVRIEGAVTRTSVAESDAYYSTRPFISKLGAWASPQSMVIPSRDLLENYMAVLEKKYPDNNVPRPLHWGGYVVKPQLIEFWQGRPGRLHDRIRYTGNGPGWNIERLAP